MDIGFVEYLRKIEAMELGYDADSDGYDLECDADDDGDVAVRRRTESVLGFSFVVVC